MNNSQIFNKMKKSDTIPLNRFTASKVIEKNKVSYSMILDKSIQLIKNYGSKRVLIAIYVDLYHDNAKEFNSVTAHEYSSYYGMSYKTFMKYLQELADLKLINLFKDRNANNKWKIGLIFPKDLLDKKDIEDSNIEFTEDKTEFTSENSEFSQENSEISESLSDKVNSGILINSSRNLLNNNNVVVKNLNFKVAIKNHKGENIKILDYSDKDILKYINWNNRKFPNKKINKINGFFRYLKNGGELDVTKYELYKHQEKHKQLKIEESNLKSKEEEKQKEIRIRKLSDFKNSYSEKYKELYEKTKTKILKENDFMRLRYKKKGETPFLVGMIEGEILENLIMETSKT